MTGLAPAPVARIRLSRVALTVMDGPFTESKELVGGYVVFQVGSKAEAVELGRRFMQAHADILDPEHVMELEIREMVDSPGGES